MKYSEFRRSVKAMNYNLEETESEIKVRKKVLNRPIACVGKEKRFSFSAYTIFDELKEAEQEALFYLVTELSKTPLNEREEEKRYRLIVDIPQLKPYKYLVNYQGEWILTNDADTDCGQTIFTESELEEIDETGFVREEVTE